MSVVSVDKRWSSLSCLDFLISDTMRLRKSLYFSQKFLLVVFLKFLKFHFRFLIKFLMWQVIQGCSFGLTVICFARYCVFCDVC